VRVSHKWPCIYQKRSSTTRKVKFCNKYVTNMPTNIFMSTVSSAMIGQSSVFCVLTALLCNVWSFHMARTRAATWRGLVTGYDFAAESSLNVLC